MNRDYYVPNGSYMQLTELQPVHPMHHQHDLAQTTSTSPSPYEMPPGASSGPGAGETSGRGMAPTSAAAGPGSAGRGVPTGIETSHHHRQEAGRKRRVSHFGDGYDTMSSCDEARPSSSAGAADLLAPNTRKRKTSSFCSGTTYEGDSEDSRCMRQQPDKKQNHSEIEKRRRDKMNTYITELSAMVPMCGAMARKLDKLTVLRMAVTHLRSVRGALSVCPLTARPLPAFVSERELNQLILTAAKDAIVLVVGCDRGRLLYVSASVTNMLNYDKGELLGQSMFDILHPKDVAKVKEQLSSSDLSPRERFIDAKTMLPVKAEMGAGASRLCPGARRSFICRIKCKALSPPHAPAAPPAPAAPAAPPVKEEAESSAKLRKKLHEKKYCVVQCTGYLKSWAPAEISGGAAGAGVAGVAVGAGGAGGACGEEDACNMSCLVAVGRAVADVPAPPPAHLAPPTRPLEFLSRHNIDGKYIYVDQRVTLALGYLPQELLGTSLYEYVAGGELAGVARTHKAALVRREALPTPPYAARRKDGSHALIQTHFKPFKNPWTKDVECLVAKNTLVSEAHAPAALGSAYSDVLHENDDMEVQRLIDSQVESHKIGSAIAEEVLRRSSTDFPSELPADLLHDVFSNQALVDNILCGDLPYQVRNNVPLSAAGAQSPAQGAEGAEGAEGALGAGAGAGAEERADGVVSPMPLDGNGEAAMAVIMSLLEADAGLGGPVNFSGLPWPLP